MKIFRIITLTLAVTLGLGLVNLDVSSHGQLSQGRDPLQPAQSPADSRNDRTVSAPGRGNPWLNLFQGQRALTLLAKPQAFFTVINTNDAGAGSLRQAILDANNSPGADVINFQIGQGTPTISLSSSLPAVTDPVTIDGSTGGASRVELRGPNLGGNQPCLVITAGSSVVRGLVINRFLNGEIELDSSNNVIENSFIGTDSAGNSVARNHLFGVKISNGSRNLIGGTAAGSGNLISGHSTGIWITGSDAGNNQVQGNLIGTNAAGTNAISNNTGVSIESLSFANLIGGAQAGARNVISANGEGVHISSAGNIVQGNFIGTNAAGTAALGNDAGVLVTQPNNTIGGTTPGAGNVISGNNTGLFIFTTNTQVQGNLIGTNAGGDALGNLQWGIRIGGVNNAIGGTSSGAGNTIAFNGLAGIAVSTGSNTGNAIRSNSVHSNAGLGIDLNEDGVTQNDSCDLDSGPNNRQNFPELSSAVSAGGNTTIQGTLNATAQTTFTIEFFSNSSCDSSGFGEGRTFIGSTTVLTSSSCNATFNVGFPLSITAGSSITATATDPSGNTSEFSRCVQVGGGSCTYRLTPANQSFPASGGTNSLTVTAPVGCHWAASSREPWIMITSGNSGSGNGTINYTVSPNLDSTQRSGSMTIAGQSFFVTQAAGCGFSITPLLDSFGINSGTGSVQVTAAAGCAWTASANTSWLTINSGNGGTGNGTVNYSVAVNSGTYRTGTMTIAGRTFNVAQAGSCNATIDPVSRSFFSGGGTGTVYVRAPAGCNWTASSNSSWVTITSATSGSGDGSITYSVAPNGTGAPRTGSLSVAGELFTVTQDAAPATIFIDDATITEGDNGSNSLFFLVHLSAASGAPVTVDYATSDGTATVGSDYSSSSGTLTFAAGHNEWAFITVPISGDTQIELHETFFVNLFNPTNATIARAQAVGTIINDDRRTVSIHQDASVVEGNSGQRQAVLDVILSAPANVDVTVHYQTEDRTATAGSDYMATSGTLTFPANSTTTSLPISVTIFGDTDIETHEFFYVRLSNAINADIEGDIGVGTIINDDGPRTLSINDLSVSNDSSTVQFTVTLSSVSDANVFVSSATADGTAVAGTDYRSFSGRSLLNPGKYQTEIEVNIITDDEPKVLHESRTFLVNLSNPVGATIADGQGVCTINDHIPTTCDLYPGTRSCSSFIAIPDCPIIRTSRNIGTIDLSRQFRDEVLEQTPRGQKYTQAYYRFAGEVVELLVFNPRLLWRTSEALERYKPIMQTLVSRAEATTESAQRAEISISSQDLEAVDDLLKDIEAEGSQQLRQTLAEIRSDLRDPQVQAEFGVNVRPADLDLPSVPRDDGAKG
ncbi:MAG TPA: Calx-beta domain-containing protein, partial [Blastocatellia bacterium]|nr:Calx-beta domain-containing protein [Blastocatellia bacterium]